MSSFTKPLITQYLPETENWILPKDSGFRYWIKEENSNTYVDVPDGFITDGASVPRILWWVIPPWGDHGQSAVLHDFLCTYKTVIYDGEACSIDREGCDEIFFESLKVLKVNKFKATTLYYAVRLYAIFAKK